MFTALPLIETSTPAERLAALQDAKKLMSGAEPGGFAALFSASAPTPGPGREAIDGFIRLAEYITTGHDYKDTHPEGKRRPIINEHHVHVSPMAVNVEDIPEELRDFLDHLMHHHPEPETAEGDSADEGDSEAK